MPMEVTTAQPGKPKRILYVITKANWGGAQRYVFDLAVAAAKAGNEVTVASGGSGELTTRLHEENILTLSVPGLERNVRASSDLRAFHELRQVIRAVNPDVIHCNSSKAGLLTSLVARMEGIQRIIFTAHGWAFNEKRPKWQKVAIALMHYLTVLFSHVTICNSESTRNDIRWMPFVQNRLMVIHHGVEPVQLMVQDAARAALAPHLSAPVWIGTIAELHPTKQLDVLISAFAQIADHFPNTALVLIGEGEQREYLQSVIAFHKLGDRVKLCGHIPQAIAYLQAFDIFALPSHSESFGYVIAEAGLAKLPVVASNVGGIPEIITNGESGILVPSGDPFKCAEALASLLLNPSLRKKYGEALYQRIRTTFSHEQMMTKTLALYVR